MNVKQQALRMALVGMGVVVLGGCASAPEAPPSAPALALDNAPMLERFARFEIVANARELRIPGRLRFHPEGAFLEARAEGASSCHIPDDCMVFDGIDVRGKHTNLSWPAWVFCS